MDVRKYLIQHDMVYDGDLVIAAVSGGADSVCLLLVLKELSGQMGFELAAVHVEHGIRGVESQSDAQFTEALCQRLGVSFSIYPVDVPGYVAVHGGGLEEAARTLRYEAFDKMACDKICSGYEAGRIKIALAHHMSDQAETVLFRLVRGTGTAGLSAMAPVRRTEKGYSFIRPLLGTAREEIEEYLAQRGQEYCTDATNFKEQYARNRIRAKVIPELSTVNSQAIRHIAQAAELAAQQQDYIAQMAGHELARIAGWDGAAESGRDGLREEAYRKSCRGAAVEPGCGEHDEVSLDMEELAGLHPAIGKELLRQALCEVAGHRKDLTSGHVQQLIELTKKTSGSRISLPYGVEAAREFDRLVIRRKLVDERKAAGCEKGITMDGCVGPHGGSKEKEPQDESEDCQEIAVTTDQIVRCKEQGERITLQLSDTEVLTISFLKSDFEKNMSDFRKKTYTKSFDYDMIKDGFTIRRRRPGDYIYMKDGHRKKLKKLLIERKIPASGRQKLWLIAKGQQVMWVMGIPAAAESVDKDTDILMAEYICTDSGDE
ncbi:MAG: tRNA lysidine(34) synthetase TilS [Clostridiales bacterium]|nr:tRNA lysidine(34) synthetase TilS [Clostridiales bacterium]